MKKDQNQGPLKILDNLLRSQYCINLLLVPWPFFSSDTKLIWLLTFSLPTVKNLSFLLALVFLLLEFKCQTSKFLIYLEPFTNLGYVVLCSNHRSLKNYSKIHRFMMLSVEQYLWICIICLPNRTLYQILPYLVL